MAPRSRALQPGGLEVWFMKRNSCVMIIFLYFMDDVSMNSMARGHHRYRSGWLVTEVAVLCCSFFFLLTLYSESICHNRAYVQNQSLSNLKENLIWVIKRKFCLIVSRCNLTECDCMCISSGIRIDQIWISTLQVKKNNFSILFVVYVQLLLIISCQKFGLIISKLVLKKENCVIYIYKNLNFHLCIILSPIAVSKSFPYNLDRVKQKYVYCATCIADWHQMDGYICAGNWGEFA